MAIIQKKVCLLGEFAVGKTSLIRRFVEGKFDDKYLSTIGVTLSRKNVEVDSNTIKLLIWDLAGGEDYTNSSYLLGAAGAILVCDLTRADTITAIQRYETQLKAKNPQAQFILVGNKSDLVDEQAIIQETLSVLAAASGYHLFLTSAKTGDNVEEAFIALAQQLA